MLLKTSMPKSQIFEALAKLKRPPIDVAAEIPYAAQRAFDKNKSLIGMTPPPKGNFSPTSSKTLRTVVAELSALDALRLFQETERPSFSETQYNPQPRNRDMMAGPIGMAKMYSDTSVSASPFTSVEKPLSLEEILKRKPKGQTPEASKAVEALKQLLSRAKHGSWIKRGGAQQVVTGQPLVPFPPGGGNPLLQRGPFMAGLNNAPPKKEEDETIPPYLKLQLADTMGDIVSAVMRSRGL